MVTIGAGDMVIVDVPEVASGRLELTVSVMVVEEATLAGGV
jgi:hypothetical protein